MCASNTETTSTKPQIAIIRMKKVLEITSLSRTTIWRLIQRKSFVQPVRLGSNSIGFLAHEIDEWVQTRPRVNND